MKIIQLTAQNVLRLRAVQITPAGELVKITGANGQGKTSVLDSIWLALDQRRVGAEVPLHKGAKKGVIKLNLGEVMIERAVGPNGLGELKITAPDGTRVASPQKFLDSLVGELSFDPLAFDRMKPLEQFEALRATVKCDVDFDALSKQNEADFNRRRDLARDAKAKRAQADALPIATGEPVDTKALLDQIQMAAASNAEIERRKAKRASVLQHAEANEAQAARSRKHIEELKKEIAEHERVLAECESAAKEARERLAGAPALPAPIDVSDVRKQLEAAEQTNEAHRKGQERARVEAEADELERLVAELTDAIDARNAAKEEALSKCAMPVPGLSLGEGQVLLNGLPFSQASAAERTRVSMAIAMAANPKLRVIRVADGSLLDSKSMAAIGEMAKAGDYQVWMEIVDESKKIGIVIEDGAVAAVNE